MPVSKENSRVSFTTHLQCLKGIIRIVAAYLIKNVQLLQKWNLTPYKVRRIWNSKNEIFVCIQNRVGRRQRFIEDVSQRNCWEFLVSYFRLTKFYFWTVQCSPAPHSLELICWNVIDCLWKICSFTYSFIIRSEALAFAVTETFEVQTGHIGESCRAWCPVRSLLK